MSHLYTFTLEGGNIITFFDCTIVSVKWWYVGMPGGKRPLTRPRHRWEGNVKMNHREIGQESVYGMHLAQDRDQWQALVNMVMNLWVSEKAGNFLTS
jgi:hypothetical protein